MLYDRELHFLCEIFKKSMVPITIVTSTNKEESILEQNFKLFFINDDEKFLSIDALQHNTIYRIDNSFCLRCVVMRLPDTATGSLLIIGPYLSEPCDTQKLLELTEKTSISAMQLKMLDRLYGNTPVVADTSPLFVMLDTFAEHIWGAKNFEIKDINKSSVNKINSELHLPNSRDDTLINMKLMEERYAAENEMMNAVSTGQAHKGMRLLADFSNMPFEKRLDDPLRNLKNYSIIMNTLLRKAAERGGVHPLYIDSISSGYATKIEYSPSVKHLQSIMSEMYYSYCELVQKHSFKGLSSPVRKALLIINGDISANITLSSLAAMQNISSSYLSSLFKKETGKSVVEYITNKRMNLAANLLKTTTLQIQTIASHCGIMVVQYFSKLFKKQFGCSPNAYRKSN